MAKKIIAVLLSAVMLLGCCAITVGAVNVTGTDFATALDLVDAYMKGKTAPQRKIIYDWLATLTSTDSGMDTLLGLAADQSTLDTALVKDYILAYGDLDALAFYLTILKCVPLSVRSVAVADWHARKGFAGYGASAPYYAGTEAIYNYLLGAGTAYAQDGVNAAVFYQLLYNLRDMFVFTADRNDANFDYKFYAFTNETFKNNLNTILARNYPLINGHAITSAEDFMAELCNIINEDANISVQMKKDFAETLVTTNSFVYSTQATGLSISATGSLTQTVGAVSAVTFTLTAQKADASADAVIVPTVMWYVNDTLVQTGGMTLNYTPSDVAGTYKVKAVSGSVASNEVIITVQASSAQPEEPQDPTPSNPSTPPVAGGNIMGEISGTGTIIPPTPDVYPTIPAPTEVSFVTVNNSTKPIPNVRTTFDDVQQHWSKDYVEVLATTGYLRGHSANSYAPDFGITREEMAVVLVRILGIEGQKAAAPVEFSDHESIQDYAVDAVYRLVELGIYKGHSEGHFAPQLILTREEISALFSRVLGKAGLTTEKEFHDDHKIAEWFEMDVENLVNYGVVKGYPDNTFRPQDDVTRAEAAVMLYKTLHRIGILK